MSPAPRNVPRNPRSVLAERTNAQPHPVPREASHTNKYWLLPSNHVKSKRTLNAVEGGDRKRVKLSSDEQDCSDRSDAYESDSDAGETGIRKSGACRQRKTTQFLAISAARSLPLGSSAHPFTSTLPILQSFVSANKSDMFRCQSLFDDSFLTPPYACSYSHSAKSGGIPLLAVATEQGTLHIINTSKRKDWDPEPVHTTLQPHSNGIFDVRWNPSDTLLATCSGDRSTHISDLETVKCVSWDPNHQDLLSTGGRDGLICIWDLHPSNLLPVITITAAHEDVGPNGKRKAPKGKPAATPKSVTGLLHSDANSHQLISSGSSDGILRCWDLRLSGKNKSAKVNEPPLLFSSPLDPTTSYSSRRPRGILSFTHGTGPTTGLIFALGADSRIHTYARDSLTAYGHSYTHEKLQTNFYVQVACSPCGRWLATGGSGTNGNCFLFDVSNATRGPYGILQPSVELKAQAGDAGAVDWAAGMLSTCWDDGTVRVWRPDIETYMACIEQPEEKKWDWCWAAV
ncbi:WD40-repeat-containing domain protein [Mycena sp. CBHHK59/15]|nr:WD40-repeat-containing domain protein [Mycena sp. CBHHK59/15]